MDNEQNYYGVFRLGDPKMTLRHYSSDAGMHEWHNLRKSKEAAPSADPTAPRPQILFERARGLRQSIEQVLIQYGVKPVGKSSIVACELVVTAASAYFGGAGYACWDRAKVKAWKKASLKMLNDTYGDRIASIVYHEDESAPHFHVHIIPLVQHKQRIRWSPNARAKRFTDGQWKVASREFFTQSNLIKWQDLYGEAIQPLGLLRGRRGSKAKHKKMRDAQRDLEARAVEMKAQSQQLARELEHIERLRNELSSRVDEAEKRELRSKRTEKVALRIFKDLGAEQEKISIAQNDLDSRAAGLKILNDQLARDFANIEQMRTHLSASSKKTQKREKRSRFMKKVMSRIVKSVQQQQSDIDTSQEELEASREDLVQSQEALRLEQTRLRKIRVEEVLDKMGFVLTEDSDLRLDILDGDVNVPHRAILTNDQRFEIQRWHFGKQEWTKLGNGKGAIDLTLLIPSTREPNAPSEKITFSVACDKLAKWFPDQQGGVLLEVLERQNPEVWKNLTPNSISHAVSAKNLQLSPPALE